MPTKAMEPIAPKLPVSYRTFKSVEGPPEYTNKYFPKFLISLINRIVSFFNSYIESRNLEPAGTRTTDIQNKFSKPTQHMHETERAGIEKDMARKGYFTEDQKQAIYYILAQKRPNP